MTLGSYKDWQTIGMCQPAAIACTLLSPLFLIRCTPILRYFSTAASKRSSKQLRETDTHLIAPFFPGTARYTPNLPNSTSGGRPSKSKWVGNPIQAC
jgi:hypothetical protein